jgi:hypothetical protein
MTLESGNFVTNFLDFLFEYLNSIFHADNVSGGRDTNNSIKPTAGTGENSRNENSRNEKRDFFNSVFLFLCSPKPHLPHEPAPGKIQERADEAACRQVS